LIMQQTYRVRGPTAEDFCFRTLLERLLKRTITGHALQS
jgi:hypothetical protein